jgi:hypothetical protein
MGTQHARYRAARPWQSARVRLLIVVLAPAFVLVPFVANAGSITHNKSPLSTASHTSPTVHNSLPSKATVTTTKRLMWARTFSPPLSLLSNYRSCCKSSAQFLALPTSYHAKGSQIAVATVTFRTNWVDVKALVDGPNISQQGLSVQPQQFKLQIMHGATPASHRANCHVAGATGHVLAFGPSIDVADGRWHTVTCTKYADTAHGTKVVVTVDGIAGPARWSARPIGAVKPTGEVRLGGRSSLASSDSLDGWIQSLGYWLVG